MLQGRHRDIHEVIQKERKAREQWWAQTLQDTTWFQVKEAILSFKEVSCHPQFGLSTNFTSAFHAVSDSIRRCAMIRRLCLCQMHGPCRTPKVEKRKVCMFSMFCFLTECGFHDVSRFVRSSSRIVCSGICLRHHGMLHDLVHKEKAARGAIEDGERQK